jgi:tetraacyldisaccharide 4'-kinase
VNILRKILYPFSLLYGEIISLRNKAFELGIINSTDFTIPIIVVGNLNVGGTGKSPQIEYLVRLLHDQYKVAVLSRGYKRKSKGFQLANQNSTVNQIGDEPMQFYTKFSNILVAVDEDRVNGIKNLLKIETPPQIILLDDAFQHRKVKAGFSILLTSYNKLYVDDTMLPTGNLREKKSGAKRAEIIVVSKCAENMSEKKKLHILQKLSPENRQTVFFSSIVYHDAVISKNNEVPISKLHEFDVLLVTGIANAQPLVKFLEGNNIKFHYLKYDDHYNFSAKEKGRIFDKFEKIESNNKIILTTEKDYIRAFSKDNKNIYYLPIQTKILDRENDFNKLILNYVQQNSRYS